jgi:polyferredoxin
VPFKRLQWTIVAAYAFFVVVPAFLPLPADDAHWFNNLALFSQWLFWGLWWPFVIASMFVVGRAWCGLFCPEGTLTEAASRRGFGLAVPRWLKWGGWPFVAFALTTVFGQLVSVYHIRRRRCSYWVDRRLQRLAWASFTAAASASVPPPVPGQRRLRRALRVAPVHFRVDTQAWSANASRIRAHPVNCAPLVRIRRMSGPSECHMCGRCSGLHDAIALSARSPNREVTALDINAAQPWDAVLIVLRDDRARHRRIPVERDKRVRCTADGGNRFFRRARSCVDPRRQRAVVDPHELRGSARRVHMGSTAL